MWGNWRAQSIQRVSRRWLIASTRHRPHRRWRLIPLAASIAATHYTTSRLSSLFPAGRESWATGGHRLGRPTRPFPSLYSPPPSFPDRGSAGEQAGGRARRAGRPRGAIGATERGDPGSGTRAGRPGRETGGHRPADCRRGSDKSDSTCSGLWLLQRYNNVDTITTELWWITPQSLPITQKKKKEYFSIYFKYFDVFPVPTIQSNVWSYLSI